MKNTIAGTMLGTALLVTGCAQIDTAEAESAPEAVAEVVAEAVAAVDLPTVGEMPSGTYEIDKTHGYVTFSYFHQGYSRPIITFHGVDATLTLDAETPTNSSVEASIDVASIATGVPIWDERIQNNQFFNTAEFPTITFSSTELSQMDSANGKMTGDLTIRGTSIPVTFDVTLNKAGTHFRSGAPWAGFSASATVLRSDWGMTQGLPATGDEVEIQLEVEFGLKSE